MNQFDQLKLYVNALAEAVEQNPNFFFSIKSFVMKFNSIVNQPPRDIKRSELKILAENIEEFSRKYRRTGKSEGFPYIPPREASNTDQTVQNINQLVNEISIMNEDEFAALLPFPSVVPNVLLSNSSEIHREPCVFIGHGNSRLWARLKIFLDDEININTVTYESEPRTGESIVPILEKFLDQATFAVLVLTAEDETAEGRRRARQNVIHEAGLFQGRIGFKRAVLLVQNGIEEFSNVDGLQYIPFTGDNIEQSFYDLQRVLKREGQIE